ncbi:MAG: hypothetical protein V4608_11030 [Bacteroidota bacterium]
MAGEQIIVEYKAQVEGFKAELKTAIESVKKVETQSKDSAAATGKHFQSAGQSIKDTAKDVALQLGLAFGVAKVIEFGKASVQSFLEAEVNANKLRFAITKIGNEGSSAFEKLIKQSERLQDVSIFSDDDIQNAQTQLATLGLNSAQIEELIPKVLDLASATGQDLGSATQTVIQGINGQTRGLKAVGLEFEATGDKTKNLSILTQGLTKFQGASAEALETTAGKARRFENAIDNIKESVGEFIVGTGSGLLDLLDQLSGKSDQVTARLLKDSFASKVTADQEKILAGAKKSEQARLFAVQETEKRILQLSKEGIEAQSVAGKLIVKDKLEANQNLLKELEQLNKPLKSGLGVDQEAIKQANETAKKKKEDALKAENERVDAIRKINREAADEFVEDTVNEQVRVGKTKEDATKKEYETEINIVTAGEDEIKAKKIKTIKEVEDEEKKAAANRKQIQQAAFAAVVEGLNSIAQIQQNNIQTEINDSKQASDEKLAKLDEELKNRVINQDEYNEKKTAIEKRAQAEESKLKRKAFEAQKEAAIISTIMNTAAAIIAQISNPTPYVGFVLGALAAVSGAAQLAVISSQPTPKFEKGGLVGGKLHRDGGTLIEAQKGEWVSTIEAYNSHSGLLEAMNKKQGDKYIQDVYIAPILKAQLKKNSEKQDNSFASNIANSLALHSSFKDGNLLDSMKQSRKAERENALLIAKAIAKNQPNKRNW